MVKRYALMDGKRCVNIIVLDIDANPGWTPPNNYTIIEDVSSTRQVDPPPVFVPKQAPPIGGPF